MPRENSPGEVVVKTRDELRDDYTRDYQFRVPGADVGPKSLPYVDGSVLSDQLIFVVDDALVISRGTNLNTSSGTWLEDVHGIPDGVLKRPAVGASGFASVTTATGGATILAGQVLRDRKTQLRFRVTRTDTYVTGGSPVPVSGIDTGPETNLPPNSVLQFVPQPAGVSVNAVVLEQNDGSGLSGGRNADDDVSYRALISAKRANPPASGNDAAYQEAIRKTPGVAVDKAFTYPAIKGPGTTSFVFTIRAPSPTSSRVPNPIEIAAVHDWLIGQFPADDGIFACELIESPISLAIKVTWGAGASNWADTSPWPPFVSGDQVVVDGGATPTVSSARLKTGTVIADPVAGQTIAFFNADTAKFSRKRIGSVSTIVSGKEWDLLFDTLFDASDTIYSPIVGQAASPYSPSMDSIVSPVLTYLAGLGPGEQVASFPDPGRRQRRQPESPQSDANVIRNVVICTLTGTSGVADAVLLAPSVPYETPVGVPAVLSYILTLGDLALYAS